MLEHYRRLLTLAQAALEQGQDWQARDFFSQALSLCFRVGSAAEKAYILGWIAELDFRQSHMDRAHFNAVAAAEVYQQIGPPSELAKALRLSARALDHMGSIDWALSTWALARKQFARAGMATDVADCDRRLSAQV